MNKIGSDVIAVVGLLDIYRLDLPYPKQTFSVAERCLWASKHIEAEVAHPKFRQFFAVHETDAWLLSDANIFPSEVRSGLSGKTAEPQTVNNQEPPGELLKRLYRLKTGKAYHKAIQGPPLFAKLDPEVAYAKCRSLKALLDEMLKLAQGTAP